MKQFLLSAAFLFLASIAGVAQAPVNDICANAIQVTVNGGYVSCNNSNTVTNAANPSCGGSTGIKDIWYKFVYTGGTVVVETQLGTNTDTRIAVYSACGGTQLGCNDDYGGTYRSYLSFTCAQLTVGNTYYIQAGGYNAVVGTFTLQVTASGILGCTDPQATNYTACATQNNGTCTYPVLTAQFNYSPTGTNCLNVQYTSTSSGNITGYNSSFPGGTPSTSTAQNPVVTYPSGGTYSATLTVTDVAGSNTATNNNVLVTTGDIVTVDITPDANPTQTSWKIFDNNNVIVAQGTSNDATFCINTTCHRFEIYDSAGNGLTGTGNYKVYLNGVLVAQGA
ncbi:MAG: PKD domain-containing protein, partial [Flavobacteriales bacterium]